MGKIIITFVVLLGLSAVQCGTSPGKDTGKSSLSSSGNEKAEITFKEYQYDFGKVAEGEKIGHIFTFKNKGTGNLIIASVTSSCGCTVPKYDSKPVPPEGNGSLEVVFDTSGKKGMQSKTITVRSNASTPVVLLKITAEVITNNN